MLNHLVLAEITTKSPGTTLGNFLAVSLSFLILLILLKKFAWGTLSGMMKKREDKIANDLDSAEQARLSAEKLEQERTEQLSTTRSEASEIIKNAKESGEAGRQSILNDTKDEVVRLKAKAHSEINEERQQALTSVKDDVADLSIQIAAKILDKELTPETHESLINNYIEGLGSSNETR
jgi:F-type H+-transporting ATPase subunit b